MSGRYRDTAPVQGAKTQAKQPVSKTDDRRANVLDLPARDLVAVLDSAPGPLATHRELQARAWRLLTALGAVSHLSDQEAAKRLRDCDGTVRDALVSDGSFLAAEDLDGYLVEAHDLIARQIRKRAEAAQRQADVELVELDAWQRLTKGDLNP